MKPFFRILICGIGVALLANTALANNLTSSRHPTATVTTVAAHEHAAQHKQHATKHGKKHTQQEKTAPEQQSGEQEDGGACLTCINH